MVTASIFMLLPVLAMAARRQRHYVLPIVDVVQSISGVRADACQVALPFEHQQVFSLRWCGIPHQPAPLATLLRVILGEEWDGDIKCLAKMFRVEAGFG